MKGETESIIIIGEGQALNMRYHQRNMKQRIDSKCMKCAEEEHIKGDAGCITPAPSEYTNRHDKVAGYIHWTIFKHMVLQVTERYCEHLPERVRNVNGPTIVWDVQVITDRTVLSKPT